MTYLVERLAELRTYVRHATEIAARPLSIAALEHDLTLRNDVLFTLLTIAQLVIDIAGELASRRGERFETYRESIHKLGMDSRFAPDLTSRLERLAGFRNVVVHEYVGIDFAKVIAALRDVTPVEEFIRLVADLERP